MNTSFVSRTAAAVLLAATVFAAHAQTAAVDVQGAWVRAAVPGQKATGAFMTLTARQNQTLVSASSPAAGFAEVHEMKLEGDIMRMRPLATGLPLPAGQAVELKPGGYHLMLQDLKGPLPKDSTVPLTLTFKDAAGKTSATTLQLPVLAAPAAAGAHHH